MSGISSGSIFFTPAVFALAAYHTAEHFVKSTARFVFAGAYAVDKYCKAQEKARIDKLGEMTDELSISVRDMISSQYVAFQNSIKDMTESIAQTRQKFAASVNENTDLIGFRNLLSSFEKETMSGIEMIHSDFRRNYTESVNRNNSEILTTMTRLKNDIFSELRSLEADEEMKSSLAEQRAEELIRRAEELADATGASYAITMLGQAARDIETGNFQSAISVSSSVITEIYMNMFKKDAEEKEKEYYTVSAVCLIGELKELLCGLKDTQIPAERDSEDLISIDLTQFMDGEYEDFESRLNKINNDISENREQMSSLDIKNISEQLNCMFSEINESISEAFCLMTYSLNRVKAEKNIYDILKEKGFELFETLYTDGDPSKASERKYRCELTGEEITISLIPFKSDENEYQTDIVIQSNDIRCSEESRELFRKDLTEWLKKSSGNVESISIKCHEETRNKNAADITDKTAGISNPKHLRAAQG